MSGSVQRDHEAYVEGRPNFKDANPKSRKDSEKALAKSQLVSTSQERQLHEMFEDFDKNRSGRIEEQELKVPFLNDITTSLMMVIE